MALDDNDNQPTPGVLNGSTGRPFPIENELTRRRFVTGAVSVAGVMGLGLSSFRQPNMAEAAEMQDAAAAGAEKPTIYLIATAHNDTQWNWTVQHTIRDCIPATMGPNWALFKKYPDYNFNYEGVIHYMFFKEYHPDQWAELQGWVRKGRWKLSGSWINAVDVCNPSAESLFRQALYGQQFYRREFGQVSRDIYLPDCFGFPYSLPTIGRHSGLYAFSSQKLSWGGWIDAPFSVGRWEGVDGSELLSALRPGGYGTRLRSDIAADPAWHNDFDDAGGRKVDLRYFGTGDQGGTPDEESVRWAQKSVDDKTAPVRILNSSNDQFAKDLTNAQIAALPHYKGELVMKTHGVGCYTSQAARKKWNRSNEMMADAAERASIAAEWLGGPAYPRDMLNKAWLRTLWHQFHDDLPGTCIPQAYTFSWNDDLLSLNQFSGIATTGVGAMAEHLDTRVAGVPLVVYNALDQPRTEAVEATVRLPYASPAIRVFDASTGAEVPSQTLSKDGASHSIVFVASAPAVGCRVYDVRPSATACAMATGISAASDSVENSRMAIRVNAAGDISSVYDKHAKAERLSAPATLEYYHDLSTNWPAWEIMWETVNKPPLGTVSENPRIKVVENGPARVSLEVTRSLGDSIFIQHIRLTPESEWAEVHTRIDWRTTGTLVKAAFPMAASNGMATFDIGLGTIERPNAQPHLYEVNAQQWAGITDAGGGHGMAILTRYKYGWDKPADNVLRLSIIRTPDGGGNMRYMDTNDIGHHSFSYAIAPHDGDWRQGRIPQAAARFNQPLRAFQTAARSGAGGREFSLLHVSTHQVAVRAVKRAEESDEWVIRLQEMHGEPAAGVTIRFAGPVTSVREINAAEEPVGPFAAKDGMLVVDMKAYQPRSFAVRIARSVNRITPVAGTPVEFPCDLDGITSHANLKAAAFSADTGESYPGELWPGEITANGIHFRLGAAGAPNMATCHGQTIPLPGDGDHNRVYLLAASVRGDQSGAFRTHAKGLTGGGAVSTTLTVRDWAQHIGQWDSRLTHPSTGDGGGQIVMAVKDGKVVNLDRMHPAYVKRDTVAWVGTHRHSPKGDQAYLFCYLFLYRLDLPHGATAITLPDNPNIRIMAVTAAHDMLDDTVPAGMLYEPELTDATIPLLKRRAPAGAKPEKVFQLTSVQSYDGSGTGFSRSDVPRLPTDADAPWTINVFVRPDQALTPLTLIAGFGDASDTQGAQRFIGRVRGGIQFWGSHVDLDSGVAFGVGKWQMITAVFDGAMLLLYKNGDLIKSAEAELSESLPEVKIAPNAPWDDGHRFIGKIEKLTIWNAALSPAAIKGLLSDMPA